MNYKLQVMKQSSFFIFLCLLGGCREEAEEVEAIFSVTSTTTEWPNDVSREISRTYKVVAAGSPGTFEARLTEKYDNFVLETDRQNSLFTVSIDENTGRENRFDTVEVSYGNQRKYIPLLQISGYFSVNQGVYIGEGIRAYTVQSGGAPSYTGNIVNPSGGELVVTWLNGESSVFTPVLIPEDKPSRLNFKAVKNTGLAARTAAFKVEVRGTSKEAVVNVRQDAFVLPAGAFRDETAPGTYFYRLASNDIDIAGENLDEYVGKSWNEIFDPLEEVPDIQNAPARLNPCPPGWNAPTEAQARKIIAAGNYEGSGSSLTWILHNGEKAKIFGPGSGYLFLWSSEARKSSSGALGAWRMAIYPAPGVSSAGRTTVDNGSSVYRVRCVR
jgi:hypothetical protein